MKNFARITLIHEEEEKTELVEITEDLAYRDRIINELASMSLEVSPMLNVPEKDKLIEYDNINDVIDVKTEEFEKLMEPIILDHFNITLKENQWVFFMESYQMTKDDLEQGVVMEYMIEICDNNF